MTLETTVESYDSIVDDIRPLLEEHWAELALFKDDIPLDVNWDAYKRGYEAGIIRAYGSRLDDKLIGYAIFQVVARHPHYQHAVAINDVIWIAPAHRNMRVGTALCEFFEDDLRKDGPIVISIETKAHAPALAALLQARGYLTIGPVYGKRFA
jgi:GNAT superfamily N-acetyltransferase